MFLLFHSQHQEVRVPFNSIVLGIDNILDAHSDSLSFWQHQQPQPEQTAGGSPKSSEPTDSPLGLGPSSALPPSECTSASSSYYSGKNHSQHEQRPSDMSATQTLPDDRGSPHRQWVGSGGGVLNSLQLSTLDMIRSSAQLMSRVLNGKLSLQFLPCQNFLSDFSHAYISRQMHIFFRQIFSENEVFFKLLLKCCRCAIDGEGQRRHVVHGNGSVRRRRHGGSRLFAHARAGGREESAVARANRSNGMNMRKSNTEVHTIDSDFFDVMCVFTL